MSPIQEKVRDYLDEDADRDRGDLPEEVNQPHGGYDRVIAFSKRSQISFGTSIVLSKKAARLNPVGGGSRPF